MIRTFCKSRGGGEKSSWSTKDSCRKLIY